MSLIGLVELGFKEFSCSSFILFRLYLIYCEGGSAKEHRVEVDESGLGTVLAEERGGIVVVLLVAPLAHERLRFAVLALSIPVRDVATALEALEGT